MTQTPQYPACATITDAHSLHLRFVKVMQSICTCALCFSISFMCSHRQVHVVCLFCLPTGRIMQCSCSVLTCVLATATQLNHCSAGGTHTSEDPTAVRSALQKLLQLPTSQSSSASTGPSADEIDSPVTLKNTPQEKIQLVMSTEHLFAWISKHREVLQKLLSEGQASSASSLAMQK